MILNMQESSVPDHNIQNEVSWGKDLINSQ